MTERGTNGGEASLLEVLGSLPDPRSAHGRRHPLGAILGLAVCAMLCGARSLYAISQWGRDQGLEVSQALGFTRERTPCVSALHQVFSRLDRDAFESALGQWLQQGEALAIDGKRLRGITGNNCPEFIWWPPTPISRALWWDSRRWGTRGMNWMPCPGCWSSWTCRGVL